MSRWDLRALFSRFGTVRTGAENSSPVAGGRLARQLHNRAGKASHRGWAGMNGLEKLEERVLLDGSFTNATLITLDGDGQGSAAGNINPAVPSTDNDYYRFVATESDFVSVLADTANESPVSSLNTRISIFSENDLTTPIVTGNNNGTLSTGLARDGWAGFIAEAGTTYFVIVSSEGGTGPSAAGTYTLRVDQGSIAFDVGGEIPADLGVGREEGSPVPDFSAQPPVPVTPILGELQLLQEDLVYRFVVPADQGYDSLVTINAQVTQPNLNQRLDSRLDIYRQNPLNGAIERIAFDSDTGRLNDAFTTIKASPGETYYIRVRSDEIAQNRQPFATGSFFLVLDARAAELPISPVTRRGSDNNAFLGFGDPTTPPTPNVPNPTFQTASYRFTAQGTGTTIITAQPTGLAPVRDPALRLYNSQGVLIAFNDNFAGASPQIEATLQGGQEYFIVIDGFEVNSLVQYLLFVESNHTVNPVDDHRNNPTGLGLSPEDQRRFLEEATSLAFNTPFLTTDADGNFIRDRGFRTTAVGEGRVYGAGDTDIFQFTPPVDMLGNYAGDNDDAGTSLFAGGVFDVAQPNIAWPTTSRSLSNFDAGDWWYTGRQNEVDGVQFGFNANSADSGKAEIYAMETWDVDGDGPLAPVLVIGGDFELVIPGPFGPVSMFNLAIWFFNPNAGRFVFDPFLGDADAPVRAFTVYDPEAFDPDGDGPAEELDDPGENWLIAGGDFDTVDGTAAGKIAAHDGGGWFNIGDVGGANASVRALAVYDPPDPGAGREFQAGPPILDAVPDAFDPPSTLFVGGVFEDVSITIPGTPPVTFTVESENLAAFNGAFWTTPQFGSNVAGDPPAWTINGEVNALTIYEMPELPEGTHPHGEQDFEAQTALIVGGSFTQIGGIAANRLAAFGYIDQLQDPAEVVYTPRLLWNPLGGGVSDGTVHALTVWTPVDPTGGTPVPFLVYGGEFLQVAGGQTANNIGFSDGLGHGIFQFNPNADAGVDGPVFALTAFTDEQEPTIPLVSDTPQEALYIGGAFTEANGTVANSTVAVFFNPAANAFQFGALGQGQGGGVGNLDPNDTVTPTIFVLHEYDDGEPGRWDRHDRPAARAQVIISPAFGGFVNTTMNIYDSNFNLIYSNANIDSEPWSGFGVASTFPFDTSRSGALDPASLVPPLPGDALLGPQLWGGETYYIEVTGTSVGRYSISVVVDAEAPDVNGDGQPDQINNFQVEEPDAGAFAQAIRINTPFNTGDGENIVDSATQNPVTFNAGRQYNVMPSVGSAMVHVSDLGMISTIGDTDLYVFRAESSGFAEIRVQTRDINDQFGQYIGNEFEGTTKTYRSNLDSAIRVFRNDFEQIAYSDTNYAIRGDVAEYTAGAPTAAPKVFYRRDGYVVIPVVEGNFYYIQVESGQRYTADTAARTLPADPDDPENPERRVLRDANETDWRFATGAYKLIVNSMPLFSTEVVNGQAVRDDHVNVTGVASLLQATPMAINQELGDPANGTGSITGVIRNTPNNPLDSDAFTFITPGAGQLSIVLTPTGVGPNRLSPILITRDAGGFITATGQPLSGGRTGITLDVLAGERVFVTVAGLGGSQGDYRIDVSGVPAVDDTADVGKWDQARDIPLRDFLGSGSIEGNLEVAGDTDIYRFRFETFSQPTITLTGLDPTFAPDVEVWEVSEDAAGNAVFLRLTVSETTETSTSAVFSVTPDRVVDLPDPQEDRVYPYYYVVVRGANPDTNFGRYRVDIAFDATDDHADGDSDRDGELDTGEFDLATTVVIDSGTGLGSESGEIEINQDTDLFRFTAPASGQASILVSRPSGSTFRPRVSILDADGNVLATGTGDDSPIFFFAEASVDVVRNQTYYIVVEGFEDPNNPNAFTSRLGQYTLSITTPPIDDYANIGEFNLAGNIPINGTTGVGQIGGNTGGVASNAVINPANDTDLFTFVAIAPGSTTIRITPFSSAQGLLAPRVRILDANGNVIADVSAGAPLEEVAATIPSAVSGARYYVLVNGVPGVPGSTLTGEYRVRVEGQIPNVPPGGGDPSVIDFTNPVVINFDPRNGNATINGAISQNTERDLYTFTPAGDGAVFLQLVRPTGSLLQASIRVLSAPNELASSTVVFDSQGIPGAVANVRFNAVAGQQYWVIVDGLGASTGQYTLRADSRPAVSRLYFPEGFTSDQIREFVSIVNPNNVDVNYTVILRYEFGDFETVISSGFIRAGSRDGLTINDASFYRAPGVLAGVPYSIVLESDRPLGATLAHYDFGSAIGDSFTDQVDDRWDFARVERDPGNVRDFVVFHNPNDHDINVTLTAYQNGQVAGTITRTFEAGRRGGFAINDLTNFPLGVFSLVLTSQAVNVADAPMHLGVVASLSHYELSTGSGYSIIGDPDGGAFEGVITNIEQGAGVTSEITLFNPTNSPATVSITGNYVQANLPALVRSFQVPARSQVRLTGAQLGLVQNQPIGLVYTSNVAISAAASSVRFGDADATGPADAAGTQYFFGDAFIETSRAGTQYFETLYFHNPAATNTAVTVRLLFLDGTEASFNVTVPARRFASVNLHERPEIVQQRSGNVWFAVDVVGNSPFVASMTHYDLTLGGGWATAGTPFGLVNSLDRI